MHPDHLALGLAFLEDLRGVNPDEALRRLRGLRERLPDFELELVWDEEDLGDVVTYELLLARDGGTVTMSLAPDIGLPFALRGMQRWRDAQVLRVDGRPMWWHEALTFLEPLWGEVRVLERLVDAMIVRRECERVPFEAPPEDLQRKLDALRRRHGLLTPEATEAWLAARGQTLAAIEGALEEELAYEAVRARVVGPAAAAAFEADPRAWDEVHVIAFPCDDVKVVDELKAGGDLLAIAERTLGGRRGARTGRSVLFETFRRHEIDARVEDGAILAARLRGAGPYVVQIRGVLRAIWDVRTRAAVEEHLFGAWLRERRAVAHVEWNWGPAPAV
jgi:putative peptide maturation system protein